MDKKFKIQKVPLETKKSEIKWALQNFINLDALYLAFETVHDFKRRLIDLGLKEENMKTQDFRGTNED